MRDLLKTHLFQNFDQRGEREREREREREKMCVWEREKLWGRRREREREREREIKCGFERQRKKLCVCL